MVHWPTWIRARTGVVAGIVLLAVFGSTSAAQPDFPSKTIQLVVPFPPGGSLEPVARLLAAKLSPILGHQVLVIYRVGAAGAIGTVSVARGEPDGHTILLNTGSVSVHPNTNKNPSYDPRVDLTSVSLIASGPFVLVANRELPVASVHELLRFARANPGKLFYGTGGNGSQLHLMMELLKKTAGIDMVHVPYKGNGPMITGLIGGEVQVAFDTIPTSKNLADAGRIRMLAVTTKARSSVLPTLPTLSESGVVGFESGQWQAFFLPKGAPETIVVKWNTAILEALRDLELKGRLEALGFEVVGSTPSQLKVRVESDMLMWGEVVRNANISLE